MAITTYAQLVSAVSNWTTRADLSDRAPECIALAEGVLNRTLDCRQMYFRNDSFTVGSVNPALPTDFAGVRAFHLNTNPVTKLQFVKADEFDDVREAAVDGTGRPRWYTIIGDAFVVSPTPDTSYTATLSYRRTLTALSAVNTTNWLLSAHPDVYLKGALMFANQVLQDEAEEAKYRNLFQTAIAEINAHDSRTSYGSSPARRARGFA